MLKLAFRIELCHRMMVWKKCQAVQPYTVLPSATQALHMPKLLTPNWLQLRNRITLNPGLHEIDSHCGV